MLTTTIAKNSLNSAAKNVVICQIYGKSKIPTLPKSMVKSPKKLILNEDSNMIKKGNINEKKIKILLILFSKSFCNSICKSRNMIGCFD
jgi:hypothetical protein|tara:strand:- start:256803 stop:257069 length:267 start_codon:yes stop_codon:yes gene_type:complete